MITIKGDTILYYTPQYIEDSHHPTGNPVLHQCVPPRRMNFTGGFSDHVHKIPQDIPRLDGENTAFVKKKLHKLRPFETIINFRESRTAVTSSFGIVALEEVTVRIFG